MFCLLHRLSGCLARLYFIINLIGRTVVDMRSESRQICPHKLNIGIASRTDCLRL